MAMCLMLRKYINLYHELLPVHHQLGQLAHLASLQLLSKVSVTSTGNQ
jgi:hypothetical protein